MGEEEKKQIEKEEPTLNVHELCYDLIPKRSDAKRGREWAKDRAEKGYCWWDIADIDQWFMIIIVKMLREFKKKHLGFPQEFMDREYLENREKYSLINDEVDLIVYDQNEAKNKMKEELEEKADAMWVATLDEIANRFEKLRELSENHTGKEEDDRRLQEATEQAFALFAKWFHHLWI